MSLVYWKAEAGAEAIDQADAWWRCGRRIWLTEALFTPPLKGLSPKYVTRITSSQREQVTPCRIIITRTGVGLEFMACAAGKARLPGTGCRLTKKIKET